MGRAFEEALPILLAYLKSSRPSLPLKKAPPLISVFFNGLYTPFGSPVCGGQKPEGRRGKPPSGARNRYAIRLADHSGLRHVVRDGTAWGIAGYSLLLIVYSLQIFVVIC